MAKILLSNALGRAVLATALAGAALVSVASAQTPPAGPAPHAALPGKPAAKLPAAKQPPPAAEAPSPQAPAGDVGEFQPVLHAQHAAITTCMDTIVGASAAVIDSGHTAISSWHTAAPNDHAFLSIVGLHYANKEVPNAAAVILAAPVGARQCDGATVQVVPVARPCSAVQAGLIKKGHTTAMLGALPVVETKTGYRDLLLPSAGGGCVVVSVGLRQ